MDRSRSARRRARVCLRRRGGAAGAGAGERARRVLHQLVALRARLHGQADSRDPAERAQLRVRIHLAERHVRLKRCVVRLPGAHLERDRQRRRRRRRSLESESAPVRQLQPAAEAQGGAPESSRRDLDRRLDGLDVLLRRRRDGRLAAGLRRVVHRPLHPRQPADRRLAGPGRRDRCGGRSLRRHQRRLGVSRRRSRQRRTLFADRPDQRDRPPAGVPPALPRARTTS